MLVIDRDEGDASVPTTQHHPLPPLHITLAIPFIGRDKSRPYDMPTCLRAATGAGVA
jgi:hypothetical protein